MSRRIFALLAVSACLLTTLVPAETAQAHEVGLSVVYIRVEDDMVRGHVDMWPIDLQRVLKLGLAEGDVITQADILPVADRIRAYLDEHLSISSNLGEHEVVWTTIGPDEGIEQGFFQMYFELEGTGGAPVEVINVTYDGILHAVDDHRALLVLEHHWGTGTFSNEAGATGLFSRGSTTQTIDLSDSSWWRGAWGVVVLGMHHIWIGIDHILFLIALVLPSVLYRREDEWAPLEKFKPALINVIKIVTLFTVAHSVTLSLAALEVINLPGALVESIIALSIALAALHNIYPRFLGKEWMIVFGFGLFHGFGFASVLGDLNLGSDKLVTTLLGFNIGVEIGQVVVICIAFPILYLMRKWAYYVRFMTIGSWLLIAISMVWFVERAFDIPITRYIRRAYNRLILLVS